MKVRASVKRLCAYCKVVKRRGIVFIQCKANAKHKQRQGFSSLAEAAAAAACHHPPPPPLTNTSPAVAAAVADGQDAFDYFTNEPDLFYVYHAGYQEQMSHWPEQPINVIINWLKSHSASWTVADFGCGSAAVSKNVNNKVFSIDLVSEDPSLIACDMAHTPLQSSSVDVAIFCLSLMGTNYPSYIEEANRVLKPSGWLLIVEVRSRLDPNTGGADPDKFCEAISKLGFSVISKDAKNKIFITFYFRKKEKSRFC